MSVLVIQTQTGDNDSGKQHQLCGAPTNCRCDHQKLEEPGRAAGCGVWESVNRHDDSLNGVGSRRRMLCVMWGICLRC